MHEPLCQAGFRVYMGIHGISSSCNHKLNDIPSTQDCQMRHRNTNTKNMYLYILYKEHTFL